MAELELAAHRAVGEGVGVDVDVVVGRVGGDVGDERGVEPADAAVGDRPVRVERRQRHDDGAGGAGAALWMCAAIGVPAPS